MLRRRLRLLMERLELESEIELKAAKIAESKRGETPMEYYYIISDEENKEAYTEWYNRMASYILNK